MHNITAYLVQVLERYVYCIICYAYLFISNICNFQQVLTKQRVRISHYNEHLILSNTSRSLSSA